MINCRKIQNFQKDRAIEKKVADFVDENFYSQLSAIPKYSNFCRTAELSAQYQGIDLSVGQSLIDEKVKNTSCPNEIGNYWASVEIYQTTRNGDFIKGWFADDNMKTTHYSYLYNFQNEQSETSAVIIVLFSKAELTEMIDRQVGFSNVVEDASRMRYAKKKIDDKRYTDPFGKTLWKLTKSYEGAVVLTTTLEDISYLKSTKIFRIGRGKTIKKLTFAQLKAMFK